MLNTEPGPKLLTDATTGTGYRDGDRLHVERDGPESTAATKQELAAGRDLRIRPFEEHLRDARLQTTTSIRLVSSSCAVALNRWKSSAGDRGIIWGYDRESVPSALAVIGGVPPFAVTVYRLGAIGDGDGVVIPP